MTVLQGKFLHIGSNFQPGKVINCNRLLTVALCPLLLHYSPFATWQPKRTFLTQIIIHQNPVNGHPLHWPLGATPPTLLPLLSILSLASATLDLLWSLEQPKSCSCLRTFSSVIPLDCVSVICGCITDYLTTQQFKTTTILLFSTILWVRNLEGLDWAMLLFHVVWV